MGCDVRERVTPSADLRFGHRCAWLCSVAAIYAYASSAVAAQSVQAADPRRRQTRLSQRRAHTVGRKSPVGNGPLSCIRIGLELRWRLGAFCVETRPRRCAAAGLVPATGITTGVVGEVVAFARLVLMSG